MEINVGSSMTQYACGTITEGVDQLENQVPGRNQRGPVEVVCKTKQIIHEVAEVNAEYPITWSFYTETTRNEKPDY